MITTSIVITLMYLLLIGSFAFGFERVKTFKLEKTPSKTRFSVIVPFRNEAGNLPALLTSIHALNYPKDLFEIIFVDDDSDDDSVELIEKSTTESHVYFKVVLNERKTNSPKKDAITTAIKHATNDWIITTDADCVLPNHWLEGFDEFIQKNNTHCIVAPVTYIESNRFLNRFQLLDLLSLQGATMGGFGIKKPFLCNGAKFGYKKSLFIEVNGFDGNAQTASGDDVFLLEKAVKKHPKHVHYLKCEHSIVLTKAQPTWAELINQRKRWAAKTSAYDNWFGKCAGLMVLLENALVLALVLLLVLGVLNLRTLVFSLFIKCSIDFLLIYKSAVFFNQKSVLRHYLLGFMVYPVFSVYVACWSLFSSYQWKGRRFKK